MTLALAAGATFEEAARLANYAGGLVVMKRGTATVSARRTARARRAADATRTRRSACHAWVRCCRARRWSARVADERARRAHHRVRQRRASICCTSATCATSKARAQEADVLVVAINDDASVRGAEGAGPADSAGRRSRGAGGGAALRGLRGDLSRADRRRRCSSCCGPTCTARAPTTPSTPCPSARSSRAYGGRIAIVGDPKDHSTRDLLRAIARATAMSAAPAARPQGRAF